MSIKDKRDNSIRKILDAAMEIFASVGFAGARMDEIARLASVNKAMIYYRIGNKKTLYAEVIHDIFGGIAEMISEKIKSQQTPEEKLRIYLKNILSINKVHPYLPRFMLWELASGGENFPEIAAQDLAQVIALLMKIIKEGVEKGVFMNINPFIPHMMAVGAMVFCRASEPIREKYQTIHQDLSDLEHHSPGDEAAIIEELIIKALKQPEP
ncbi:MAG: TetR/AcrR family transcriptional regulator [Deltaproteobacteria bacterium]|nr:TetR/AcrR family transcriptional regulator [Deltaproteobacteria bacterium]